MKPSELKAILEEIDVDALNKTVAHYRTLGATHIIFAVISVLVVPVAFVILVSNIVLTPLFLFSTSIVGQLLVVGGFFIFINGMFELANNFRSASIIELRKANLLNAKQKVNG